MLAHILQSDVLLCGRLPAMPLHAILGHLLTSHLGVSDSSSSTNLQAAALCSSSSRSLSSKNSRTTGSRAAAAEPVSLQQPLQHRAHQQDGEAKIAVQVPLAFLRYFGVSNSQADTTAAIGVNFNFDAHESVVGVVGVDDANAGGAGDLSDAVGGVAAALPAARSESSRYGTAWVRPTEVRARLWKIRSGSIEARLEVAGGLRLPSVELEDVWLRSQTGHYPRWVGNAEQNENKCYLLPFGCSPHSFVLLERP